MIENIAIIELKNFIKKYNFNKRQLALRIFVPENRISQILNAKRRFTPETDVKLCKLFNLKPQHFINLQAKFEDTQAKIKYKEQLEKIINI